MGQKTEGTNSFAGGLVSDLNAIATPPNVLTDCINGTMLTFNGNELVLQNDMGNAKINEAKLTDGFIPIGVKENGGIIYIVSHKESTGETEIGSFPGPTYPDIDVVSLSANNTTILDGDTGKELDVNKLGVVFPLTDKILTAGDPFLLVIDINDFVELLSYPGYRGYYIPKLISSINNIDTDITKYFTGQIQNSAHIIDGDLSFQAEDNKFWFLSEPLDAYITFEDFVQSEQCFFYPNIPKGKLGIKFILEDIDLFNISADKYGNFFPSVRNDIVENHYTLMFDSFDILDPSRLRCNAVRIDYTLTDNLTGELITILGETSFSDLFEITGTMGTSNILKKIRTDEPRTYDPVFLIDLGDNKNKTISYTITPLNTTYGIEFTNYIIQHTNLDLSKTSLEWSLVPNFQVIEDVYYSQKLNPYNDANDPFVLDLKPINYTGEEKLQECLFMDLNKPININVSGNKLKNLGWLKKPTVDVQINTTASVINNMHLGEFNITATDTYKFVSQTGVTTIVGPYQYINNGVTITTADPNPVNNIGENGYNNSQYTITMPALLPANGVTNYNATKDFSYFILTATMTATKSGIDDSQFKKTINMSSITASLENVVGYNIHPLIGKFSKGNDALSESNDITKNNLVVIPNTNPNLIINGHFRNSTITWITSGPYLIFINNKKSFKQNTLSPSSTGTNFNIKQSISGLVTNSYYLLSFYAGGLNTNFECGFENNIESLQSTGLITNNKWKYYQFILRYDGINNVLILKNLMYVNSPADCAITNISLKLKLVQDITYEPVQAVYNYYENVLLKVNTDYTNLTHSGEYLPCVDDNSNAILYEKIDTFSLNTDLLTSTADKIPSLVIRKEIV